MASADHASCDLQLHCSATESGSPAVAKQAKRISSSEDAPASARPTDIITAVSQSNSTVIAQKSDTTSTARRSDSTITAMQTDSTTMTLHSTNAALKRDAPTSTLELSSHSAMGSHGKKASSNPRHSPKQQRLCPSVIVHNCRDGTPHSRRTVTQHSRIVRRCLTPQPVHDTSFSDSSSESTSSDDCAELRRLCRSQEDLTIKNCLESEWQVPLYNHIAARSPQLQHAPGSEQQFPSSKPVAPHCPHSLPLPLEPKLPFYDPRVPPPSLVAHSPGPEPKLPFYDPHVPPPSLLPTSPLSSMSDSLGAVTSFAQTSPLPPTGDSFGAVPSFSQSSPLSATRDSFGAVPLFAQNSPLSSTRDSFEAVPSCTQNSPLSSTRDNAEAVPSFAQTSSLPPAWESCRAVKELTPVKRVTDEDWPLVKRSRSSPERDDLDLSISPTQVFRGGLQWRGPSTYRLHCLQQDKDGDKDRLALDMFCYQDEDTAEVVFRPKPAVHTPQTTAPTHAQRWRRRLSRWAPASSNATQSSEMALTTAPIVALLSKPMPYSLPSKAGLVDSHCHLDFIFSRVGHSGTYAKFRLNHRDTFPDCYEGCVANFCNPATFRQRHMWNSLLSEDGVWGAFGCHPHMANEYNKDIEEDLVHALDHPSVVALGEIGLDYSHKNQCNHSVQKEVFRRQLQLALNRRLPLVIHSRDSTADTIQILQERVPRDYLIHRHCFTGGWKEAQEWLDAFPNLCLGLTPLVSFDRVGPLTEVARKIPLDRLLIETDSPYFLPKEESRNLRCSHPGMAIYVAMRVASLRSIPVEAVLAAVRENTKRIYSI
ncbi:uncharacterized protein LOC142585350 [Dermacentor variabilis]|uniref:uncharacterized protein LOC142585350 n=1 Tax=Dermacentor variabilis TaxID=34621 RepID=UPI003F5AFC65